MRIEFKNVNLGDSILLNWTNQKNSCYGIVDCNRANGNPVLIHIKNSDSCVIEFIIISHPHLDHYSGILEVLEHCESKGLRINRLLFTFGLEVSKVYEQYVYGYKSRKALLDLFEFVQRDLVKSPGDRTIKDLEIGVNSNTNSITYSNNLKISFRGPHSDHLFILAKQSGVLKSKQNPREPDLNYYCSVLEIDINGKCVLLCSDATKAIFKKLINYYKNTSNSTFHLVQVPHHGSTHNYYEPFWNKLNRTKDCPAVFSVGDHRKYKLPDLNVVASCDNLGYEVHSTNPSFGIREHFTLSGRANHDSTVLDMFSKKVGSTSYPQTQFNGNQVFDFE